MNDPRAPAAPNGSRTANYDYELPPELIAQEPAEPRDSARLLVMPRHSGELVHARFRDLGRFLRAGDLLVANRSRVIPARLHGRTASGSPVELLLLRPAGGEVWECLGRPGKRLRPGTRIHFGDEGLLAAEVTGATAEGWRLVALHAPQGLEQALARLGELPLPPYIRGWHGDPERYQTVYADVAGSAAAPTAGLHFTPRLMDELRAQGIEFAYLTLHIGLDTFRPVRVERVDKHPMHAEYCEVPEETVAAVEATRARGGRVVAVGTTSVRALESAAQAGLAPWQGWTRLFIRPGYEFRVVDGLITNFHLPRSTLLMLVSALVGRQRLLDAYRVAIAAGYRFYSFGDAMLII